VHYPWRRPAQLPPIPPLTETYIIPAEVRKVYVEISPYFDVQVGRNENWVLGADTSQGGLRVIFTRRGVMTSLQAVRDGKDITRALNGDIKKAIGFLSPK
jgi:hypothetical protein